MFAALRTMRADKLRPVPQVHTRFDDMHILITGANSGIGLASAIKYASLGASHLVLGVRSKEKGDTAAKTIRSESNREGSDLLISVLIIDMSKIASIKKFTDDVAALEVRIDVALLNAGIHNAKKKMVGDLEADIAVNSTGTALLAALMLPLLESFASHSKQPSISWGVCGISAVLDDRQLCDAQVCQGRCHAG